MAFEPVFEKCIVDSFDRVCSGQTVVEARLLPPAGTDITKVLSAGGDVTATGSECFTGEARYSGRVNFKVLFLDAEGNAKALDYNADFSDKINSDEIKNGMKTDISATLLDMDIVSLEPGEIKLAAVVEVAVSAASSETVKYLSAGGEGIYTHEDRLSYSKLASECKDNFSLTDELSDVKAVKILVAEPKVCLKKAAVYVDSVELSGEALCDLICEGEDGLILSYRSIAPFTQEISAPGARPENVALVNIKISSVKADFASSADTNGIICEYTLGADVKVFAEEAVSSVSDAFSAENELLTTYESVSVNKVKAFECVPERVDGSVTLDVNMPIVDNILAVAAAKLNVSNVLPGDGKLTCEGIAGANIIYYSAEVGTKSSVDVELPFSITLPMPVCEKDTVTACGTVTAVNVKIRRGNELDVKADVILQITVTSSDTKVIITELKMGEVRAVPDSAVTIHIAKSGETLWDVAKALSTTPELVLLQNPKLTMPLSGGERILAYRHLKRS